MAFFFFFIFFFFFFLGLWDELRAEAEKRNEEEGEEMRRKHCWTRLHVGSYIANEERRVVRTYIRTLWNVAPG